MKYIVPLLSILVFCVTASAEVSFTDQDNIPHWAMPAVTVLYEQGIITGNADGTLDPLNTINRGEFAALMVRLMDTPLAQYNAGDFDDIQGNEWYAVYAATALKEGWLSGYPDGTFRAEASINRAEINKIIWRATNFPHTHAVIQGAPWYDIYFYELNDIGLLAYGTDFSTAEPAVYPTRAEVIEQLFRFMILTGRYVVEPGASMGTTEESAVAAQVQTQDTTEDSLEQFEYVELDPVRFQKNTEAGQLNIVVTEGIEQSRFITRNETYTLHSLTMTTPTNTEYVRVGTLRFRLIGGEIEAFDRLWLRVDGEDFSEHMIPISTEDTIEIDLTSPIIITKQRPRVIELVGHVRIDAEPLDGRFVLYRPEWIGTDTDSIVALFPLAGTSIKLSK